jgi:hypothetical protein
MFEVVLFDMESNPMNTVAMSYNNYYDALEFAEDMYNKYVGVVSGYEINEYGEISLN